MRTQNLMLRLVLFLFVSYGFAYAQTFEIIEIGDGTQRFNKPVWSPNGERLAFWGYEGIYVCKWDGTEQPKKIVDTFGENLMWASDSELVYWKRKIWEEKQEGKKTKRMEKDFIKLVNLNGKEEIITEGNNLKTPNKLPDGTVVYLGPNGYETIREGKLGKDALKKQFRVTSHYPPIYDSRIKGPVFEDTDIWISSLDGTYKKRVTYDKQYYFPQLSPDGKKIIVNDPSIPDHLILNLNGEIISHLGLGATELSPKLFIAGIAINDSWSPDSKSIIYLMTINDGDRVFNHDIWIINISGTNKTQITDTPREIEMDPQWSPDGTKIVYWSETSRKIFVIKL